MIETLKGDVWIMQRWMKLISMALLIALAFTALGSAAVNAQGTSNSNAGNQVARRLMVALLRESAKTLNLRQAQILKELRTGTALADVIKAHSGDVNAIQTAVKTTVTNQINQAVTNKRMQQTQADKLLAALDGALDKLLNAKWPGVADRTAAVERQVRATSLAFLVRETAKQSNITQRELLKEIRSGKTLAQVATDHKADPNSIITAAVTDVTNRINQMVKNNRLSQADADKLIAALQPNLTQLMNTANPFGSSRQPNKNGGVKPTAQATQAAQ